MFLVLGLCWPNKIYWEYTIFLFFGKGFCKISITYVFLKYLIEFISEASRPGVFHMQRFSTINSISLTDGRLFKHPVTSGGQFC